MLDVLEKCPLFSHADRASLQALLEQGSIRRFAAGEKLLEEGQPAKGIHIVLSGFVKVIRTTSQGRELILFLARSGNIVGEGATFQSGPPAWKSTASEVATAVATERVQTLFIAQTELFMCLQEHADLALCMLKAVGTRQRMFIHKLAAQAERGATRRVAAYLCHRLFIEKSAERSENILDLGLSREDLANLLGIARETLSRQLSFLMEKGIISMEGRRVYVQEYALLKKMSHEG